MLVILEMDCGSQITVFDDGTVLLPDLSNDAIPLETVEDVIKEVRAMYNFRAGHYISAAEHKTIVEGLQQKLKKARGK